MAKELPYLGNYKNVNKLFEKIASAKIPEAFVQKYLYETLGLKASGDRQLIPLLRSMGFLDTSNKPTSEYSKLKNSLLARGAIAEGIKRAYGPLFAANETVNELPFQEIKGLIAQVAGADTDTTSKIAGTFNALLKSADFSKVNETKLPVVDEDSEEEEEDNLEKDNNGKVKNRKKLHPEFHYNIQIHLPTNASEETYLNIFNALRKSFQ